VGRPAHADCIFCTHEKQKGRPHLQTRRTERIGVTDTEADELVSSGTLISKCFFAGITTNILVGNMLNESLIGPKV
jgi:hypothetical protein